MAAHLRRDPGPNTAPEPCLRMAVRRPDGNGTPPVTVDMEKLVLQNRVVQKVI